MTYTVAVRALCEFTAKAGDLDLRFTPSPSAQEGIAGHAVVAARRPAGYRAEVSLSGDYLNLHVRGRADGYDPAHNQLEEIKTFRGDLSLMPDNHRKLHWAQVKVYGWLLCQQFDLPEVRLALVYFDIVSQKETLVSELFSADVLRVHFERQCGLFLAWAEQELVHRQARNAALTVLRFPYAGFRVGQRPLAEAVYKSVAVGSCLLAQAPTGIGKTIGTLFPLLKAMPGQTLDKVFYLAAKTPGRRLALAAVSTLRGDTDVQAPGGGTLPLRVLELVARDKACEYPDRACHGESCPLASGFYDRLPAARAAALTGSMDQQSLRTVALEHQVCPYYLSQELARWADVVVGDYNYYFDISALLHGLTLANQWRVAVLIDEAHNLVERGRAMYTAELDQRDLRAVRKLAPAALRKPLERVGRQWRQLSRSQDAAYQVYDGPPPKLLVSLQNTVAAITDYLTETPLGPDPALQRFYFDVMHFCRLAILASEEAVPESQAQSETQLRGGAFLFDQTRTFFGAAGRGTSSSVLCIRNLVPAPFLKPRFEAARSAVLFSATLSPRHYFSDLLGLPERTSWIDVESPFRAEQLQVRIVDRVSTRFQHRGASLTPIARLMAEQFERRPGNYLAFFSSFDYLDQVATRFCESYPAIPVCRQSRRMDEPARQAFLDRFSCAGQRIGFAVLGGAFAEGIDLPGERLVGAFIATLGLPQINPVNEQMKQRMGAIFGAGYDYTYLYPGLQKVVQAAGRVIRTGEDRGLVYLIDDRFAQPAVLNLLPSWWTPRVEGLMEADATATNGPGSPALMGNRADRSLCSG